MIGEYYLAGVMETTSAIRLNEDSSFDFFFSAGAIDRFGKGKWVKDGDSVILQNSNKPLPAFELIYSGIVKNNFTTIKISDKNKMILRYVHYKLETPLQVYTGVTNEVGIAEIATTNVTRISLLHELWPDKAPVIFNIQEKDFNYFEFNIHPSIGTVYFEDVKLVFKGNKLIGGHPLLTGEQWVYTKEEITD